MPHLPCLELPCFWASHWPWLLPSLSPLALDDVHLHHLPPHPQSAALHLARQKATARTCKYFSTWWISHVMQSHEGGSAQIPDLQVVVTVEKKANCQPQHNIIKCKPQPSEAAKLECQQPLHISWQTCAWPHLFDPTFPSSCCPGLCCGNKSCPTQHACPCRAGVGICPCSGRRC